MSLSRRSAIRGLAASAALSTLLPTNAGAAQLSRIGVIGAGMLGGTVGGLWVKAGHEVMFSSRKPEELLAMAYELGPSASVGTPLRAAQFGEVLLFAVPSDELPQLGRDLQTAIAGKIVLDAGNPVRDNQTDFTREARVNGVGPTDAKYLAGTRLVRAFSSVDATQIAASAGRENDKLGVPLAGDNADAIEVASQLVRDAGCEPVVVGNLAAGAIFQRGALGFRQHITALEVRRLLGLP